MEGYQEAVRLAFGWMREGQPCRFGMLDEAMGLLKPGTTASPHYCNAGVSPLTVAANGDVYPCFMFINKEGFRLGHVGADHELAAFSRKPEHGIDLGCPGRQFMMNGEVSPFRPDELLKNAVVDTMLDCVSDVLDVLEAAGGGARDISP